MRVLCVGRHPVLSEHFCRVFRDAGAKCAPAVGATEALRIALEFEPHVIVIDHDLLTPALLESWALEPSLAEVPALAVSLTRRPEESAPHLGGVAAVIYLPLLDAAQATMLLSGLHRPRGVSAPPSWRLGIPASSVPTS